MTYYDDILNVNAYLRQKMKSNLVQSQVLRQNYAALDNEVRQLTTQADDILARARALAAEAGVDVSDLAGKEPVPEAQTSELLVRLPANYNFQAEFERLRAEAHAAGFTDVHPEELLSADEMASAQAFDKSLNAQFAADTGLTGEDIKLIFLAVAIRVVTYFVISRMLEAGADHLAAADREQAMRFSDTGSILSAPVPFDVPDNPFFKRRDIVGFDKYIGPVLGVLNFLTNTVTTFDFKSYIVRGNGQSVQRLSTPTQFLRPIFQNMGQLQSQLLAAAVREASVLNMLHMEPSMAEEVVKYALQLVKAQLNIGSKARIITKITPLRESNVLNSVASAAFINTLVTGFHAVQYNPKVDGSIELYAVRTNKILAYSNAIAMTINSVPAFLNEDLHRIDWGGVLTTCFSLFHSIRFWIDAKTAFLVSAYKKEVDEQLQALDQYFIME